MLFTDGGEERAEEIFSRYNIDKKVCVCEAGFYTVCNEKTNSSCYVVKGIVHPKMKILSSFTHPQVVPNLNEFLSC